MLESLLCLLDRHRKITVAAAVVLFLAGGTLALLRLSINDSSERWLPASSIRAWQRFEEHYTYGDTVALAVEFLRPVRDDDIELLKSLREDLKGIEGIAQVTDVSLVAGEIEGVSLTQFLRTPGPGEDDPFAMYRGVLFDDPRRGAGPEKPPGRTLLTFVELSTETVAGLNTRAGQAELDQRRRRVVREIYGVLDDHARDDVHYHVAGGIVIQYELEKIAHRAVVTVLPVALLVTLLALGVGFRSATALAIAVLGGLWSVAVMLGGVALAGCALNVVTVGGPTLMVVIVIATAVHFAHYYSTHDGTARGDEGPHFVRWVAVPCLGAAAVTGVGFLMLAFNELGPARQLGIELFAGSVLAFFGAFLVWMPLHPFRAAPGRLLSAAGFRRYHRLAVARPWTTTLVIGAAMAAFLGATLRVRVDADPFSFFEPQARIAKALKHFSDRDFGLYILDVVLVPRPDTRPKDPAKLEEARQEDRRVALAFQRRIERRPEVRNVISAVAMKARQQSFKLDLRRDVKRFLAFYNTFNETFKNWTDDRAGQDSLRISFMVHDPGGGFRPLVDEVRAALPQDRFECFYTGSVENVVTLSENLVGGVARGLAVATLVMALLCGLLFRSVRLTLVAVLPNALPVLVVFGVMRACGVPLNSGSAMVSTIALGIALNDTVHFVMHYRRRREAGETTDEALDDTFGELGRPIVLTSVVNCLGFAVFLLCDFRPMVHFGLLASIAMAAALLGDLVLLPNLLKLVDRGQVAGTLRVPSAE